MAKIAKKARKAAKKIERADKKIARAAADRKHHPVAAAVRAIGHVGDQPPMLALSAAVLAIGWWRDDRRAVRAGARMLLAEVASIILKDQVKRAVTRTRPHVLIEDGEYELRTGGPHEGKYNSFPSGHTAGAVAVSRAFVREYPEAAIPSYAFAAAVAAGQIPESAHYPTDVSAGIGVGLASEAIADWVFRKVEEQLDGAPHRAAPGGGREVSAFVVEPVEQP